MKKFKLSTAVLLSLIPAVFFALSILIMVSSKTPEVKYVAEKVRPGYQTEPAAYIVEASYWKYWHDSRITLLVIVGFVITVFGTFWYIGHVNNLVDKRKRRPAGTNFVILGIWLVGALCIFAPMIPVYGSSSYSSTITPERYEANKDNLDAIFPEIESEQK